MPAPQDPRPSGSPRESARGPVGGDAEQRLRDAVEPLARAHDLVIEDVSIRPRGGLVQAVVVVDLAGDEPGSPDLDTIADLSREVSALVDEDDALLGTGPSELEITTPGAERALTEPRHFRRARTRLLRVRTADGRDLVARLLEVRDDGGEATLVLRPERAPGSRPTARSARPADLELPLADVASARVELEFSRPADAGGSGARDEHDPHDEEG